MFQATPVIFAHRGASADAPENTLAAFKLAATKGAQWVEWDVQLSEDEQVVVIHDSKVNRTTNGQGAVSAMSLQHLTSLDAGSWFHSRFSQERVPTLEQCLECTVDCGMGVNIEIKGRYKNGELVEKTLAAVEPFLSRMPVPPLYSSSSIAHLRALRRYGVTGYAAIMHYWPYFFPAIVKDQRCVSLHLNYQCCTEARIAKLKQMNKKIFVYTVNDRGVAQDLLHMGVDGLFTDDMSLLDLVDRVR